MVEALEKKVEEEFKKDSEKSSPINIFLITTRRTKRSLNSQKG